MQVCLVKCRLSIVECVVWWLMWIVASVGCCVFVKYVMIMNKDVHKGSCWM